MKFRSIKGTKDILPPETSKWQHVEAVIRKIMQNFNYEEIRTPIFEQTNLFTRSIGELTDIVSKEMYTFLDMSKESITLRPEGTAPVIRAFIQNNLTERSPLTKLYYIGPMFRQEKPQAGRLRQFHQFGAEALGSQNPQLDVEMMILPMEILRNLGIEDFTLKINSVGCEKCRPGYKELLKSRLRKIADKLSPDSKARIEQNPLRILDSKDENDKKITADMPSILDHLCIDCNIHFTSVCSLLDSMKIRYEVDSRLVRGLDYYTKTAFEITSSSLGSQNAIAGGGRYDLLVEELGGKPTPGVGVAAGIERILMLMEKNKSDKFPECHPRLFLVGVGETAQVWTFFKAIELRKKGLAVEVDYLSRSTKSQMREANRQKVDYVIVVGEEELKTKAAKIKNMKTGEEKTISLDNIEIP